jgi:hypothetical protein
VAIRELAGEVLEIVVGLPTVAPLGDDLEGERVAADTGQVVAEQVDCSFAIAGSRSAHHFDVVAFPVHLPATATLGRGPPNSIEVGGGDLEGGVGVDGQSQRYYGLAAVDGSLCSPVAGRRLQAGGYRPSVVLSRRPGIVQMLRRATSGIVLADRLTLFTLHETRLPWRPETTLMRR